MKNISVIFLKQLKDTLKNKAILIQFVMFPLMAVIMENSVKFEDMPEKFFVKLFLGDYGGNAGEGSHSHEHHGEKLHEEFFGHILEFLSDFPSAKCKQRDVDQHCNCTDCTFFQQMHQNHSKTGQSTGIHIIRLQKQVECNAKQHTARNDLQDI